jgi:hypothetical protein
VCGAAGAARSAGERRLEQRRAAPQHDNQSAKPPTVHTVAGDPHEGDDLLDGGRVGRIPQTLLRGGRPA